MAAHINVIFSLVVSLVGVLGASTALAAETQRASEETSTDGGLDSNVDGGFAADLTLEQEETPRRIWHLSELLQLATQSPDVREAQIRASQAEADVVTAGLIPNPQLQVSGSNIPLGTTAPRDLGFFDNFTPGVGVSEELELGGKRSNRIASAEAEVHAGSSSLADARRNSRFDVQTSFYKALSAQEHLRLARESLARYLDTVRLTRKQVEVGNLAGADLNKIELETFRYQGDTEASRLAAVQARSDLFSKLGSGNEADPERDIVEGDLAEHVELPQAAELEESHWMANRPDLIALTAQLDKARADADLARSQAVPDVTIGVAYNYSPPILTNGTINSLGVTAAIALPFFNRNQGEIQKADLEVEHAMESLERSKRDARREVALALAHVRLADGIVQKLEGSYLQRAERAKKSAEKTFLEGHTSLLEVLEAQRTYLETRGTYLDALLERRLGALELQHALGKEGSP
jgi:cobalt-zinc-cadmium efflux system outer membrane protein